MFSRARDRSERPAVMVPPDRAQEGFSLSNITQLAACPPEHLTTPLADLPRNTLILYIARVPGSRDVFLTTLKPRERVVSAEDVQSCLYYVHVSSEDDRDLSQDKHEIPPVTKRASRVENIPRKPVQPRTNGPRTHPLSRPLPSLPVDAPSNVAISTLSHIELHTDSNHSSTTVNCGSFSSLTLIRRDPGSAHQWNVATISDPPVAEVTSASDPRFSLGKVKRTGAPLYIDITNSGYDCFRTVDSPTSSLANTTFRRRLYMPGSTHAKHGYGSRDEAHRGSDRSSPAVDTRAKGYTFDSPWGMPCEFSTGMTGRSLKCKCVLGTLRHASLSELRFNLPTNPSRNQHPTAADMITSPPKRSSYMQQQHTDYSDAMAVQPYVFDEEGNIDLSLGREQAGGGFGGRDAKLGKLLIEPDGLKMLDLLVAANIGLWWRAYERAR